MSPVIPPPPDPPKPPDGLGSFIAYPVRYAWYVHKLTVWNKTRYKKGDEKTD